MDSLFSFIMIMKTDVQVDLSIKLKDNCIQNFYLGRYIVRYTVENLA